MQKSLKCDCENQKRWNQRRQTILDSFSSRITVRFCGQNQQNSATHQSKSSKASKKKNKQTTWQIAHFLKSCTQSAQTKKRSKLLVFFILSLDGTSAWDNFCHDSCCLASLFSIVRIFFTLSLATICIQCNSIASKSYVNVIYVAAAKAAFFVQIFFRCS